MANYEPSPDAPKQTIKQEQYMCTHMQEIAQDFERKLFTTGGALALNKCFWYLISWKWMEDGSAKMKTLEEAPGELFLTIKVYRGDILKYPHACARLARAGHRK